MRRRTFVAALACLVVGPHEPIAGRKTISIPKPVEEVLFPWEDMDCRDLHDMGFWLVSQGYDVPLVGHQLTTTQLANAAVRAIAEAEKAGAR